MDVYVPNGAAIALETGASCSSCSALYSSPVAGAVTDATGHFTITKAPSGKNIPLIVQIGKWRMQYVIPEVTACAANDAPSLTKQILRLPKNHTEGDIPAIAISTGAADSLECLLLRMGLDPNEYTPGAGGPGQAGRIHIFTGGESGGPTQGAVTSPPSPEAYTNLWDSVADLNLYDLVLFSCEGNRTAYLDGSDGPSHLLSYVNNGGRVFASHFHHAWFTPTMGAPANPFASTTPALATWTNLSSDGYIDQGVGDAVSYPADIATTLADGTTPFPEGVALKAWLGNVGALDSKGKLDLWYARNNAAVGSANTDSQPWISLDPSTPAPNATEYFSFDTPIGSSTVEQCGRVVYSGLHVSGGPGAQAQAGVAADYGAGGGLDIVPGGCATRNLTAQEKALEFMIFDLSSCLIPPGLVPVPPTQAQ